MPRRKPRGSRGRRLSPPPPSTERQIQWELMVGGAPNRKVAIERGSLDYLIRQGIQPDEADMLVRDWNMRQGTQLAREYIKMRKEQRRQFRKVGLRGERLEMAMEQSLMNQFQMEDWIDEIIEDFYPEKMRA